MKLYNTLTRQLEEIKPNAEGVITMYNCGPTVYWHQHIGNFRAYSNWDILHRALVYEGKSVKRIMNITDVGHLTSDEDSGEDKMEKGAKKLGMSDPFEVANFFLRSFLTDMSSLNMWTPSGVPTPKEIDITKLKEYGWIRATESVEEIIELIKKMEEKGYVYETKHAVYFDVTKYDEYTNLTGQRLEEKLVGVRDEVNVDTEKKNPADFVLWMKRYGEYSNHTMHWNSPWGDGFPGWHIECSAMGIEYLGDDISVHTGGIEHIPVHHTNERAQNFGALEKEVVRMWVHNEHLQAKNGEKLSKSLGNAYTISELIEKGYDPLDIRWILVSVNYKIPLKFSLEALDGARNSRLALISRLKAKSSEKSGAVLDTFKQKFVSALDDNLNMSSAFAVVSEVIKSTEKDEDIVATILDFDRVLGLNLGQSIKEVVLDIPDEIVALAQERASAKEAKDYAKADEIRKRIDELGFVVMDTPDGPKIVKK